MRAWRHAPLVAARECWHRSWSRGHTREGAPAGEFVRPQGHVNARLETHSERSEEITRPSGVEQRVISIAQPEADIAL